ncbi:MAG: hypothetical protein KKE20_00665 [Nanoarchaeota archaeon]|nr:hypothetical protein [Nanoarchaeota archaeon]
MREYKAKIIEAKPCAVHEGNKDNIVNAYLNLDIEGHSIWFFVPTWMNYFPYPGSRPGYGIGIELLSSLKDKSFRFGIKAISFGAESSEDGIKKIVQKNAEKNPSEYTLYGEVKRVGKNDRDPSKDFVELDCGIVIDNIVADKGIFKPGDYISVETRLDAYFIEFGK